MEFSELNVVSLTKSNGADFTGNARVIVIGNMRVLQSYRTIVAYELFGKIHRTWDGWSASTARHIGMFVDEYAPNFRREAREKKFSSIGKYFDSLTLEKPPVTIFAEVTASA